MTESTRALVYSYLFFNIAPYTEYRTTLLYCTLFLPRLTIFSSTLSTPDDVKKLATVFRFYTIGAAVVSTRLSICRGAMLRWLLSEPRNHFVSLWYRCPFSKCRKKKANTMRRTRSYDTIATYVYVYRFFPQGKQPFLYNRTIRRFKTSNRAEYCVRIRV